MSKVSKFIKLNTNVLMEWIFDNEYYISENYKVITNLNENKKRNFLSTTNLNNINNNLFQLDSVLKKYTLIDTSKYNFLQEQDYSAAPTQYDKVRIYLPTSYNFVFDGYIGLYLKIYAYGYYNKNIYELSNIFFDATSTSHTGYTNLAIPFVYDEQEWGKYYDFEVPSVDYVSNQRSGSTNSVIANTINWNLTLGEGLSKTGPIFVDFQYLYSKEVVLGTTYYYAANSYKSSFSKTPDYNTLGVTIQESTEGDFFEIFGTYGGANENLDDFIEEQENQGSKIRIEYDIYLYEENIQTNMQTVVVSGDNVSDYTKKILYRPVLTFSNTTAAIKVVMRIIDLVKVSQQSKFTSIGLDNNIQKYGKKLISLDVSNMTKLKIYNSKPDEIVLGNDYFSSNVTTEIIKVNSPQLIEVGKIIVNSPTSSNEYKGMGLLNLIITPFDNVIQFRLAIVPQANSGSENQLEQYDLSNILNNSEIVLNFKSDTESIDKKIYNEADNDYKNGIVNFKLVENDLNTLKTIYNKGYNNFYLTILSNKIKTLLYSGTFSFYEDITFIDSGNVTNINETTTNVIQAPSSQSSTSTTNTTTAPEWPKAGKTVIIYTKFKDTAI